MNEAKNLIKNAAWLHDKKVQQIFALLEGDTKKTMAVGGIVRDSILNKLGENSDIDFATIILPNEVMRRAKKAGFKAFPTGIEHGTITLVIDEKSFEVTTLRQDIKTDGRHAKVSFGDSWLLDAKRRDFTMNALYASNDGELFDPLGLGLQDCLNARVKFIGDAKKRLLEDKLRFYRFFRFSASHGGQNFDRNGLKACQNIANDLGNISSERIGVEMMKMLSLDKIAKTIEILMKIGVFVQSKKILDGFYRYEEIAEKPNNIERLALLLMQEDAKDVQKKWRLSNKQMKEANNILKMANFLGEGKIYDAAYQASLNKISPINILNIAVIVFNWSDKKYNQMQKEFETIIVPPFPLNGQDLIEMGYESGRNLGENLSRLKNEWIKSGFKLNKKDLISKIF